MAMTYPAMNTIETNGARLEVLDKGSGDPVVFVHGGMSDEGFAAIEQPALSQQHRLIYYHRRGWGTAAAPETPTTNEQHAADCRELMRQLGIERAHFVGQSSGGVVLLQVARDFPDAVHSLALLEPGLPSVLFASLDFGAAVKKMLPLFESGDKAAAIEIFAQEVGGSNFRAAFDAALPPGYFERWVADVDTLVRADMPPLQTWSFTQEDAAKITQPVLNMTGADTRPYFREAHEIIKSWIPHAENVVLPNTTHVMLQVNAKGAAEELAKFFASHPIAGSST